MKVGQVIGSTTLQHFNFVIKEGMEKFVKRGEFVSVKESVTGKDVLGVIKDITISNELLPDEFGRAMHINGFILKEGEYPVPGVKILGYEGENGLELPRHGINPGTPVNLADDEILKRLLKQEERNAAFMGTISTRKTVPVHVSINDMVSRHTAVLAMTGAGKSYTTGVLIEELLKKHGSVVVFDPHSEYKYMKFKDSEVIHYKLEGSDNRIKIEVKSLSPGDFTNLVPGLTDPQRDLLDEAISTVSKFYEKYDLKIILKFLNILYDIGNKKEDIDTDILPEEILIPISKRVRLPTIGALMRRIMRLERMNIFEIEGTPIDEIVKRNQLSVIDLSGADARISETIITALSRSIFEARKRFVKGSDDKDESENNNVKINIPTFLIIEEAHNFAPRGFEDRPPISRGILRKIAREGRKFGVGLCIVSQRPNKLDADILSQCNSQIIMKIVNPSDQEFIRQSVESITEDIVNDLPSLARGEAIIVGSAIKLPVPVKIRRRETRTGGEDIDIVGVWGEG